MRPNLTKMVVQVVIDSQGRHSCACQKQKNRLDLHGRSASGPGLPALLASTRLDAAPGWPRPLCACSASARRLPRSHVLAESCSYGSKAQPQSSCHCGTDALAAAKWNSCTCLSPHTAG
jgi:hypothetical protein